MRLVLIFTLIGLWGQLHACKCDYPPTVKESYYKMDFIIHGRVTKKEIVSFHETYKTDKAIEIKERLKTDERSLAFYLSEQVAKVTIEIIEVFKGESNNKTITIYTSISDASCGYNFDVNSDYLIYASRKGFFNFRFLKESERQEDVVKENSYWTHICTRTKNHDKIEIKELRQLPKK
jgi:hypothetical protein